MRKSNTVASKFSIASDPEPRNELCLRTASHSPTWP